MTRDPVRRIADAVLYEGYILWPYRRSALKNQRRFTFGGVYPPAHSERHPDDSAWTQTELLLRAGETTRVQISIRFLQVVARGVLARRGELLEPVDELIAGGERHLAWDEAVQREVRLPAVGLDELRNGVRLPVAIAAGSTREQLPGGAGALIRSWDELSGQVAAQAAPAGEGVVRLSVRLSNTTPLHVGATHAHSRGEVLRRSFCSTHTLLQARAGEFVSLTDPPAALAGEAAACACVGTWPVLVGEPPDASTILSSPIILEDYPRVAPESPGDLFDGGEIDKLLILNILALTDEEKAEMAATDPRAREILERAQSLTAEQLMALHGTLRELGMPR